MVEFDILLMMGEEIYVLENIGLGNGGVQTIREKGYHLGRAERGAKKIVVLGGGFDIDSVYCATLADFSPFLT